MMALETVNNAYLMMALETVNNAYLIDKESITGE